MQAAIELALAQHAWDVARVCEQRAGRFKVAPEVECCDKGGGHYFGVAHLALRVLVVLEGLQKIIAKAVYCQYRVVHRFCSWLEMVSEQGWWMTFHLSKSRRAAHC